MRRTATIAAALLSALVLTAAVPAAAVAATDPPDNVELTLMATTDVHGHVYDWDYFQDAPYPDDDTLGLTRVGTAVDAVRAEKGAESVVVLDNGDAIQGTPLTYYYGMGEGAASVLADETTHPMAEAFNAIGYDAQVVGNHEYNYGLELLAAYEGDLGAPLLGANVIDVATGEPYHDPYTLIDREIDGETVTIGVLGLVTPGVRIWDRQHVEGVLEFRDLVETAAQWVPVVAEQADVVVVLAHTGQGTVPDEAYDAADLNEDVANNIAVQVPGIDVLVAGHSHLDEPQTLLTNTAGEQVLLTQPSSWARSVSEVTLSLAPDGDGGFDVDWSDGVTPTVTAHYGTDIAEEDADVVSAVADKHATTVDYVNTPVAASTEELLTETSRYEDTPIIDFINHVQAETVAQALAGGEYADLPVVSQASPFSRTSRFPQGEVTIRDIAGLYIYENTLRGVLLTGAQLKDYLEYSARYFVQVEEGAVFDPATGTNAAYPDRPSGVPDYNYDALSGLDYTIDISRDLGDRIQGLSYPDGAPVDDDDELVLAVNNYRQSGGGAFPHVAGAPVVYDELQEIRQLLIDWASERGRIDPADFFVENWALTTSTEAPTPTPAPSTPTPGAPSTPGTGVPTDPGRDVPDPDAASSLAASGADAPVSAFALGLALLAAGAIGLAAARARRLAR
ncbi:bifunctional UDP-sugar hydrolase/5'-nucleotidase [Microbacterium sp. 18062]|uniref:bifunctional metallophosphatase/5'-nucleotidase n=1 Tax=Microbacterium sp. 18062 TaxID=2681410 RepID=UPI00135C996D|nr:5'-nucleotidase C-terminal domain-containing protein [Microbacterium sp. 18062]